MSEREIRHCTQKRERRPKAAVVSRTIAEIKDGRSASGQDLDEANRRMVAIDDSLKEVIEVVPEALVWPVRR